MTEANKVQSQEITAHKLFNEFPSLQTMLQPKTYADPYPISMFAFGLSTVLLSQTNITLTNPEFSILVQGLVYGGFVQLICSILHFIRGNLIGCFLTLLFGFWWCSLYYTINLLPETTDHNALQVYKAVWLLFLILNCIVVSSTVKLDICCTLSLIFISCSAFFDIVAGFTSLSIFRRFGGVFGIIAGLAAVYTGTSHFYKDIFGYEIMPNHIEFKRGTINSFEQELC